MDNRSIAQQNMDDGIAPCDLVSIFSFLCISAISLNGSESKYNVIIYTPEDSLQRIHFKISKQIC